MRWLMEGGGDGHDIHLQVPVVLRSIFHVQNEDSLKTGWDFLEFWFQGTPHHIVSPTLPPANTFPLSLVSQRYWFAFIPDSVPGSPPGHRSLAGSKEQEERPRKAGVDEVAAVPRLCCAAHLDPLELTTQTRPEEPARNRDQQNLGRILLPLDLRKLCSSHPLTPTFFCSALMEQIREKYLCLLTLQTLVSPSWRNLVYSNSLSKWKAVWEDPSFIHLRGAEGYHT